MICHFCCLIFDIVNVKIVCIVYCLCNGSFVCMWCRKVEYKVQEMGRKAVLATCTLNQWAMDFDGNCRRILRSKFACSSTSSGHVNVTVTCLLIVIFFLKNVKFIDRN